mmetsp:Transcript_139763/g.197928  ORF Transcript_139763/g.197928 Transcript_139763/m.197928 type:complete len:203 (+) Transcript_139763:437-1045(+)
MEPFVAGDQLVGESQPWHQATLLEPEDCAEGSTEEHALHCSKGNKALGKARLAVHPLHCPVCLLTHRWHGVDSIEEVLPLFWVLDVLLNQKGVGLRVDVLHCDLEAIEGTGFRNLNLRRELRRKVFQDDAIRGREKGKDMLDEVLLALIQIHPILAVLSQIDLLRCPERCFVLLVHLPNFRMLQRKHDPALRVFLQERVLLL